LRRERLDYIASPANSEDRDLEKKRKRVGDVASSRTSIRKEISGEAAAAKDPEPDMFELLDL
jgi:ribosome assembly protein YihI (activator of Der GTPase)